MTTPQRLTPDGRVALVHEFRALRIISRTPVNPTTDLFEDAKKRFDVTLKDYELKVAYLTDHFQRMWTRFNYFVVIEAALMGGRTIFGDKELGIPDDAATYTKSDAPLP